MWAGFDSVGLSRPLSASVWEDIAPRAAAFDPRFKGVGCFGALYELDEDWQRILSGGSDGSVRRELYHGLVRSPDKPVFLRVIRSPLSRNHVRYA